jgi:hypothetical protein
VPKDERPGKQGDQGPMLGGFGRFGAYFQLSSPIFCDFRPFLLFSPILGEKIGVFVNTLVLYAPFPA